MTKTNSQVFQEAMKLGLIAGLISLSVSIIGMVELFSSRELISGVVSLGQVFLFAAPVAMGFVSAQKAPKDKNSTVLISGAITGLLSALPLIILVLLAIQFDLRQFLPNVSPALTEILTFSLSPVIGSLILIVVTGILGFASAGMYLLPNHIQKPLANGIIYTLVVGLFSENLAERLRSFFGVGLVKFLFDGKALKAWTALVLFIIIVAITIWWTRKGESVRARFAPQSEQEQSRNRKISLGIGIVFLLVLPLLL